MNTKIMSHTSSIMLMNKSPSELKKLEEAYKSGEKMGRASKWKGRPNLNSINLMSMTMPKMIPKVTNGDLLRLMCMAMS